METWRSLAALLERADIVVPGHGPPIRIDSELIARLLDGFSFSAHWAECPDVAGRLRDVLDRFPGAGRS